MENFGRFFTLGSGDVERRKEADRLLAGRDNEEPGLDQPFGQSQGHRAFLPFKRRQIFHFDAEKKSGAPHLANPRHFFRRSGKLGATLQRIGQEVFFFDGVEHSLCCGAGQGEPP